MSTVTPDIRPTDHNVRQGMEAIRLAGEAWHQLQWLSSPTTAHLAEMDMTEIMERLYRAADLLENLGDQMRQMLYELGLIELIEEPHGP